MAFSKACLKPSRRDLQAERQKRRRVCTQLKSTIEYLENDSTDLTDDFETARHAVTRGVQTSIVPTEQIAATVLDQPTFNDNVNSDPAPAPQNQNAVIVNVCDDLKVKCQKLIDEGQFQNMSDAILQMAQLGLRSLELLAD